MKLLFLPMMVTSLSYAQMRQSLYRKPEAVIERNTNAKVVPQKVKVKVSDRTDGNLAGEIRSSGSVSSIDESVVIIPTKPATVKFNLIKPGDVIQATIEESVFSFANSKAPIKARILYGPLRGTVFLGEANLENNSKRTIIEFKKLVSPIKKELFQLQASGLDSLGILGIKGKLISQEDKFFLAEFLSAGAAGYADSTIEREQNVFGNQTEARNADTFAKKALVGALSKTADHFGEKLKQAPEYSVLQGPVEIQILILEQPKLINE